MTSGAIDADSDEAGRRDLDGWEWCHVTVLAVKGNQVRLGIGAPKDVAVHREEIYKRVQAEKADVNRRHAQSDLRAESQKPVVTLRNAVNPSMESPGETLLASAVLLRAESR